MKQLSSDYPPDDFQLQCEAFDSCLSELSELLQYLESLVKDDENLIAYPNGHDTLYQRPMVCQFFLQRSIALWPR